jgi:hypothetical protein
VSLYKKILSTNEAIQAIRATQLEYGLEGDWNLNRVIDFIEKMDCPVPCHDDLEPLSHCMFPEE